MWGSSARPASWNAALRPAAADLIGQLPWCRTEWAAVFGGRGRASPAFLIDPPGGWGSTPVAPPPAAPQPLQQPPNILRGMSHAQAKAPDEERSVRIEQWRRIAREVGKACATGRQLSTCASRREEEELLTNTLFAKSTNTLSRRASSWSLFLWWRKFEAPSNVDSSWPPGEDLVYEYVRHLACSGAPATRAQGFLEALFFADGAIGLPVMPAVRESARIRGAAMRSYERKQLTRKATPLKVDEVKKLEGLVLDREDAEIRAMVGSLLFILFARARARDASAVEEEPFLDLPSGTVFEGYVEVRAAKVKTSKGIKRRRLGVPLVAPAYGLRADVEGGWAKGWLDAREKVGLKASPGRFLIPSMAAGGIAALLDVPMSAPQVTAALRNALEVAGVDDDRVQQITSHSLKATLLSWLAKAGASVASRRLLGGHIKPGEKSVLEYSRDGLAGPLRELVEIIASVREGRFNPDAARSGRWVANEARRKPVEGDGERESTSTSSSSSASEAWQAGDEKAEDNEGLQALSQVAVEEELFDHTVFHYKVSKVRHLKAANSELDVFICGTLISLSYVAGGVSSQQLCKRCRKALDREESAAAAAPAPPSPPPSPAGSGTPIPLRGHSDDGPF